MTYLQPRKRQISGGRRAFLYIVAFVIIASAVIQALRPQFFPALFSTIARPFWRVQLAVELGSLDSREGLLQENAFLQRQLDDATVRLSTVKAVEDENAELKALLGRASTTPYTVAAVLKRPPLAAYDELEIDAGADTGFVPGNPVYAPGNVLIGKIVEVLPSTSKVVLFSSPGQSYDVLIGSAHTTATANGRGGGQYDAELPRDVKVTEGDAVIDPSLNSAPFGIVTAIEADPAQAFERVLFAPPVNVYSLRWVLVDPVRTLTQ